MKQVIGLLLLIVFTCSPILAQQKGEEDAPPVLPGFTLADILNLHSMVIQSSSGDLSSAQEQKGIATPKFVFKDGALYLEVFEDAKLIPVSGGASGCFSLDLWNRMDNLKKTDRDTSAPPAGKEDRGSANCGDEISLGSL